MSFDLLVDLELRSLIPPLQPNELKELEDNLIREGNRDPIVFWKEKQIILDGHHRYDLCRKYGIPLKPPIDLSLPDRNAAKEWIIRNQFGRRNLSPYQRSVLALRLEETISAKAKANLVTSTGGENPQPLPILAKAAIDTREEIAKVAHVSHGTMAKVKVIEEKATPEQKAKLVTGEVTVNQVYVQLHRQEVKEQIKQTDWPTGKYRVIYADPPWQYSNSQPDYHTIQDDHYPTMPLNEICALPVSELALDNTVLFLWATSPILEDAFKVINAWGFKYKASFIWDKVKHNMGHYNSVRHEFLLIAVKGSCQPDTPKLYDSVQSIERTDHSRKPAVFREIIEALYPYGLKLELFACEKVEGWDSYGNEISTTVST